MKHSLLAAHGFQGHVHSLIRQGGGADVFCFSQIVQEGVAVREMLRDGDGADHRGNADGFRLFLLGDGKRRSEAFLHLVPGGLLPLRGGVRLDDREALVGKDVDLAGESAVHPLRQENGQLVNDGRAGGHGGSADIIHVQGHDLVRRPSLLQAADRGGERVAVIAHGGLEEVIGMVFKGHKEEEQAQGGHEIADDIVREDDLEHLRHEIGDGIPENGDLLVMVELLPAESVEEQAAQDLRIGDGIQQPVKAAPAVDQVFVKVGDPL